MNEDWLKECGGVATEEYLEFAERHQACDFLEAQSVDSEIVDHSRWSVYHRQVFQVGDNFYVANYSVGATEMQDESPFEYDKLPIRFPRVQKVEKTVVVYE